MSDYSAFGAVAPHFSADADPVLVELCRAASRAAGDAWAAHTRAELLAPVGLGADGTPTYLLDQLVEAPLVATAERLGVNLLSEEIGFVDNASSRTAVIDPLDGSANAASGVPLSCFSGAVVADGQPMSALTCWLETGATISARPGWITGLGTSGRTALDGAAVSLLRPKSGGPFGDSTRAWLAVANRAARVRILSTSCLEAMLVAQGATDAFVDPGSDTHRIVDLAAAMLLVPAAGGAVVDAYGRALEFDHDLTRRWSGVVAATPELAAELAATIAAALPRELGTLTAGDTQVALRRARETDVPVVRELLDETAVSHGRSADATSDWAAYFRRIDQDPESLLIVAEDGSGEVVATVQYALDQTLAYGGLLRATLESFAVRPDQRGHGLGGAIVGWLTERARADGAGVLQLTSNLQRTASLRFYERLGFEHSHAGLKLVLATERGGEVRRATP